MIVQPMTGAPTIGRQQPTLSADEIAALLDTPVEEKIDAAIVYKLNYSKCEVNEKIDSFAYINIENERKNTM